MNQFEHETNGALIDSTPLFASNLLALFYVLRNNFVERRLAQEPIDKTSQAEENKERILLPPATD